MQINNGVVNSANLVYAKTMSKKNQRLYSSSQRSANKLPYTQAANYIHFGKKNINELYEEYNWYINHDHTPAIESFLKIEDDEQTMDGFLSTILGTQDRSYQFMDSIVKNPRQAVSYIDRMSAKVGPNSQNVMTFLPNSPYRKAYENYLENKYHNAHTLSELLRVRPDWRGSALMEKHRQLKGNDYLEIGTIPKEFPHNHLFEIVNYLGNYMEIGMKTQKEIPSLSLGYRTYDFKYFTEGKSDKCVFGVFTPEQKKYVFKIGQEKDRSLDAPFALGTLAKIDHYLTTNRSRNSAPLCYYNHDKNLSVYKYIEHTPVQGNANDLNLISEHLPDFKALGLKYNDNVGYKNCFLLDDNSNEDIKSTEGFQEGVARSEWISVDNDHVTYNNKLQPSITKYNAPLPNAMQMFF